MFSTWVYVFLIWSVMLMLTARVVHTTFALLAIDALGQLLAVQD